MTTSQNSVSPAIAKSIAPWIDRGMEALWLLAVVLVPLAFLDRDFARSEAVIGYVEVPKVALLRTLAGLMAMLWLIEWGLRGGFPSVSLLRAGGPWRQPRTWPLRLSAWLRGQPTNWLILAVWFFLATTLLSTVLSGSFNVSLWGEVPGQDGYPAYTIVAYILVFAVITTHLKTQAQLWRILASVAVMGTLVAGYGIFQHYGNDFLDLTERTGGGAVGQVTTFMGNAIFSAAVMIMTIPVTLALAVSSLPELSEITDNLRRRAQRWALTTGMLGMWGALLAAQILGLTFTFSRGPWVGGLLAMATFLVLVTLFVGWRTVARSFLLLGLAAVFVLALITWQETISILSFGRWFSVMVALGGLAGAAVMFLNWRYVGRLIVAGGLVAAVIGAILLAPSVISGKGTPVDGLQNSTSSSVDSTSGKIVERFSSIKSDISGGLLSGRTTHWRVSWKLIRSHPWFEFDRLSLSWLRPLIGYGPDLFRYTYLLESPAEGRDLLPLEPDHAHNFFIHQTVEQGYLGLLSSLGLFAAAFFVGGKMLLWAKRGLSDFQKILLIGLLAVFVGRFLEMMVGVARVSDLTVLWALLAVFAALPAAMRTRQEQAVAPPPATAGNPRRRNRPRGNPNQSSSRFDWRLSWRLAVSVWLIGGIGVLTWVNSVNYVRASVVSGEALRQFNEGDLQSALSSMEKATELAPDVSHYRNNLASIYLAYLLNADLPPERGCSSQEEIPYRPCLAVQSFQSNLEGVAQRPLYFRHRLALANSAFNLPQLAEEAVQYYRESLSLVPDSWLIRNELGDALIEAGQPEEAIQVLEESLAFTGNKALSSRALFLQGRAYLNLDQPALAQPVLERSLELGLPAQSAKEAYRALAEYYTGLGQPAAFKPKNHEGFFNLGLVYSGLGQHRRAVENYDRAIEMSGGLRSGGPPQYFPYFFNRGLALFNLGQYLQAIKDFKFSENYGTHPDYVEALVFLGLSYGQLGQAELATQYLAQNEPAIEDLDRGFRLNPQAANVYYTRGLAYVHLGQVQRSISFFDEASRRSLQDGETHFNQGLAYFYRDQYPESISEWDQAIMLNPQHGLAYARRAIARANLGMDSEARRDRDRAIELGVDSSIFSGVFE